MEEVDESDKCKSQIKGEKMAEKSDSILKAIPLP